jgi:transporter family protein
MGRAADALVYDFPNKSKNRAGCAPERPSPSACLPLSPRFFAKIDVENINSNLATFSHARCSLQLPGVFACHRPVGAAQYDFRTNVDLSDSIRGTGASRLCYFRAPKPGPAAPVAPVDILNVVMVVIFGVLAFGERPFGRARHVDYARIASNLSATTASMRARIRLLPTPEIAGSFNDQIGNAAYVPFTVS